MTWVYLAAPKRPRAYFFDRKHATWRNVSTVESISSSRVTFVTMSPRLLPAIFRDLFLRFLLLLNILPSIAYDCPLPECDYCIPDPVRQAPGIGFELTTSYG